MTRHFITFLVLALLSYALLYLLRGKPDVPLLAWISIWLGVALATALIHVAVGWIWKVLRRRARK
jgi:hypothetical protein